MSSSTPPPGPEGSGWEQLPPDQVWSHPVDAPPARSRGRITRALVIVVALTVIVGGGAFALIAADPFNLFKNGPQAAEAIPADAEYYISVDLDPSAQQKIAALRFLTHFPAFEGVSGVTNAKDDIRKTIFEKALEASGCDGVSFDKDVEPWLGNKFAFAGMPPANGETSAIPVVALEVSDEATARVGLKKLSTCDGSSPMFGIASEGDYLLLAETQKQADRYAGAAATASLADDADYKADMAALGDLGVATAWVDIDRTVASAKPNAIIANGVDLEALQTAYRRAAVTLRFESNKAEIATAVYGNTPAVDHGDNQIVNLPDTTVLALSEAGGANRVKAAWSEFQDKIAGTDIEGGLRMFEDQTGLSLPADLETLLGDNIMFAVDSKGLTASALNAPNPSLINAGVRLTGDKSGLLALYDQIDTLLREQVGAGNPFVKKETSDGLVVATNDSYADALAGNGGLGDSDAFTSVVSDAASQEFVLFFNFDQVEDQILQAARSAGAPSQVIDNLRPLQALAVTANTEGSYLHASLVVSVND
ncbi:MAG: DUF3352 domain-containing protein [Nocardioidaceae bacterium]